MLNGFFVLEKGILFLIVFINHGQEIAHQYSFLKRPKNFLSVLAVL